MNKALETVAYAINLAYNSRNAFPFSTYGETFFLAIQNVIITLLIIHLAPQKGAVIGAKPLSSKQNTNRTKVLTGAVITAATGFFLWSETFCPLSLRRYTYVQTPKAYTSLSTVSILQAVTLPLSLISKAPQIMTNYKYRSTGNLSAFAVFNNFLGCVARVFTTKQEVDDPLIFWGFASAAVLNAVLAVQMIMYWKDSEEKEEEVRRHNASEKGLPDVLERTGGILEVDTGKRWSRKLD